MTLNANGGTLLLEPAVNEYGWTLCSLVTGSEHIYLGADTLLPVISALLKAVTEDVGDDAPTCELEGQRAKYIMLLSEAHHALYAADAGQERLLFWQNAVVEPMTVVGTMRLSVDAVAEWQSQLRSLLTRYPSPPLVDKLEALP